MAVSKKNFEERQFVSRDRLNKGRPLLYVIIILAFVALLTSIYLVKNHFADAGQSSACDFSESISCSLVNSSVYAELFHVPVAVLGGIWSLLLGMMAWSALYYRRHVHALFWWSVVGVLFVVYFLYAEWVLRAVCPLCTVVHVITVVVFILAFVLWRREQSASDTVLIKISLPWIVLAVMLTIISLVYFNVGGERMDYAEPAKCIASKGVNMYSSFRCSVCAQERELFGDAFQFINEIECHPQGENAQVALCLSKGIERTPTWVLEPNGTEVKRIVGFYTVEELAQFAGCAR